MSTLNQETLIRNPLLTLTDLSFNKYPYVDLIYSLWDDGYMDTHEDRAAYSAEYVASYILGFVDPKNGVEITLLNLHQLLYYCQGFSSVIFDRKLFSDKIYKGKHGPLVRRIQEKYKKYVGSFIPMPDKFNQNCISEEDRSLIGDVFCVCGQFAPWKLKQLIDEMPFYRGASITEEIRVEDMKERFKDLVFEDRN